MPWWSLAAVGRVMASVLETAVVVATIYVVVELTVGVDLDWRPAGLVPLGFLLVGAVGHSLIIGGLTLLWKRVEVLNDMLLLMLFFLGGIFVSLEEMPGWMAAVGTWLPVTHPIESGRHLLLERGGLTLWGDGGLTWMVGLAAGWLAAGAVVFHRAAQVVRRDGTLTRY